MSNISTSKARLSKCPEWPGHWAYWRRDVGRTDEKEFIRTIHSALDQGYHLSDTAPIYWKGTLGRDRGEAVQQYGAGTMYPRNRWGSIDNGFD